MTALDEKVVEDLNLNLNEDLPCDGVTWQVRGHVPCENPATWRGTAPCNPCQNIRHRFACDPCYAQWEEFDFDGAGVICSVCKEDIQVTWRPLAPSAL